MQSAKCLALPALSTPPQWLNLPGPAAPRVSRTWLAQNAARTGLALLGNDLAAVLLRGGESQPSCASPRRRLADLELVMVLQTGASLPDAQVVDRLRQEFAFWLGRQGILCRVRVSAVRRHAELAA